MRATTFIIASLLFSFSTLSAQGLTSGLKAHFPFNKNLNDVSGNGNHLQVDLGSTSYVLVSGTDSAISFNGALRLSSVNVFDASSYSAISISMWVKTSRSSSSRQIIFMGAFIGFATLIEASTGKFMPAFDGNTSNSLVSRNAVNDGVWRNYVLQNDGDTTYFYIDGVLDGKQAEILYPATGGSDNILLMGASRFNTDQFTGQVNDLRVYNRMLSQNEIDSVSGKFISIDEVTYKGLDFEVFPNPSKDGKVFISKGFFNSNVLAEITDITGKTVWEGSLCDDAICQLNAPLKRGVYIVSLKTDGEVISKKLVVQ